jgi:two-component system, sensor histidine kinase YesM
LKFILQPIVENAIYHGIKERRGPGHIVVKAFANEQNLSIVIQDDGVGMSAIQLQEMREGLSEAVKRTEHPENTRKKKGYGMLNVQARILLAFGEEYGLFIDSKENEGTKVEILLPIISECPDGKGEV